MAALKRLDDMRRDYIRHYYAHIHPALELPSVEEQQKEFFEFETRPAEFIIKNLELSSLGWFATPETSDAEASDLEASGDLFIDTQHMEIIRWETTAASKIDSAQYTTKSVMRLDSIGAIEVEKSVTREALDQRGYPSMDEAVDHVAEPPHPSGSEPARAINEEEIDHYTDAIPAPKAKTMVDDIARLVDELVKLYQNELRKLE